MGVNTVLSGFPVVCLVLSISVFSSATFAGEQTGTAPFSAPQGVTARPADKQRSPVVLVLDASGSMWGQIDGKAKIVIAREVLNTLIDSLPADLQVGLSVYGHRREKDCTDIEMVMPIAPLNPAAMKAKINAIKPKGKTPLSDAVRQAAEALQYTEHRASVILVSDGLETCNADPCSLAADLAKAGVDFKVHVVGFDISKEDQGRLRCLADKTGGLFLAAADARSLHSALTETMAKVQEPPAPITEEPGSATVQGPENVAAGSSFDVTWEGPNSRGDFIAIARKQAKDNEYSDYAYTERGNPAHIVAPGDTGSYELRYVHAHSGKIIGRANIRVTPVQASVQPPSAVPAAGTFQVSWQGPSYEIDYITIAEPSSPAGGYDNYAYTRNGNPVTLTAPALPGNYEVRYILGNGTLILARAPITIDPVSALVQPPVSVKAATSFQVEWQGPNNDGDYITVAEPAATPSVYDNYSYTRNGNPAKLTAPAEPGDYEVRYIQANGAKQLAKASITVQAVTAEVTPPEPVRAGETFQVSWQGPNNNGDYITVAQSGDPASSYISYTYTRNGNPATLVAPPEPGNYEVRYIMAKDDKLLAMAPIAVTAVSAQVTAQESVAAGADFEIQWQGPDYQGDYITIAGSGDPPGGYDNYAYTRNGNPATLVAPPEPGNYEVRYIMAQDDKLLAMAPIAVTAVSAQVTAPESVAAGADFEIQWQGPNNKGDYVTIVQPDAAAGEYVAYVYTNQGSPAHLRAPDEPGPYELRYIMNRGTVILGRTQITVK